MKARKRRRAEVPVIIGTDLFISSILLLNPQWRKDIPLFNWVFGLATKSGLQGFINHKLSLAPILGNSPWKLNGAYGNKGESRARKHGSM